MPLLPSEEGRPEIRDAWLDYERRAALGACIIGPLLAVALIPAIANGLLYVLFLTPPAHSFDWSRGFTYRPALALAGGIALAPWIWFAALELERNCSFIRTATIPLAAIFGLCGVATFCAVLQSPAAAWYFVEWTKIRTPNPSFARNTLFWEQRAFEREGDSQARERVGLVGSSQVYSGIDARQLAADLPHSAVEKNCLAGFGPMQYPVLINRIDEREFNQVVCMISEFDMFREDDVPLNRLRWAANLAGVRRLWSTLPIEERRKNRAALADLEFASLCPGWRLRDAFQRTLFGYWWDISRVAPPADDRTRSILAISGDLEAARESVRRNVRRTAFVDVNFACFRSFAEHLVKNRVALVVLEGQLNPALRGEYPPEFRTETRHRMEEMANSVGYVYLSQASLPTLDRDDFADGYHLNDQGRHRLTAAVSRQLRDLPHRIADE
ncbi:MAG TPA: hypothetical protein VGM05_07925 [Planctomycetaceae bacterium]|jgi:hypothetical protein